MRSWRRVTDDAMALRAGPCARAGALALALCLVAPALTAAGEATLRVCADGNHLPYSNEAGQGFENELATLVAEALGRRVETTWWPQRRGFLRNTLHAGRCDVVVGVPAAFDPVLTTAPYYRSCYAWVFRADEPEPFGSLDDPGLTQRRIGVHLIGDDYTNSPPAHALAERGVVERVVGYSVYGDYGSASPLRAPVDAVARGEIDAAILWGPIAGYFAQGQPVALRVEPIPEVAGHVFAYPIAMGVRRDDDALRDALDRVLRERATEVDAILDAFGVPRCAALEPSVWQPGGDDTGWRLAAAEGEEVSDPADPEVPSNPYTGDAAAIERGAALFKKLNCSACHGAAGGGGMGPNLTDEAWKTGDGSDPSLLAQILDGRAAMPPYRDIIGQDEAWQLIAFIRTLYRGDPARKTW